MAHVLWRSKTGYRRTDSVIHRLIRGAVQTGVFSTFFAAGDLICFGACTGIVFREVSRVYLWYYSCLAQHAAIRHVCYPPWSRLHKCESASSHFSLSVIHSLSLDPVAYAEHARRPQRYPYGDLPVDISTAQLFFFLVK